MRDFLATGLIAAALLAVVGAPALAQSQNRVDAKRDWAVFEASADGGKICSATSRSTVSRQTRIISAEPSTLPDCWLIRLTIAVMGSPGARRGMMKIMLALIQIVRKNTERRRIK